MNFKNFIKKSVDLIQWNINGVMSKITDLDCLYGKYNFDILALNETRLKTNYDFNFKDFNCFRQDASDLGGRGVMLLIKNHFNAKKKSTFLNQTWKSLPVKYVLTH